MDLVFALPRCVLPRNPRSEFLSDIPLQRAKVGITCEDTSPLEIIHRIVQYEHVETLVTEYCFGFSAHAYRKGSTLASHGFKSTLGQNVVPRCNGLAPQPKISV